MSCSPTNVPQVKSMAAISDRFDLGGDGCGLVSGAGILIEYTEKGGTMRKMILSVILSAVGFAVSAQQLNHQRNHYREGDILEKRQFTVDGFSLQGENGVWSLEGMELARKTFRAEYTIEKGTLMKIERGNRTYYRQTDDTIQIVGTENVQMIIGYDMPETWLRFPMQLGDSVQGYFSGTGKYCDRLFVRRFGTYLAKADAMGILVLPDGDSLQNVVRVHTDRYVGTMAVPIDTMRWRIPVFTVDSIVRRLTADTVPMHEEVYRWYAEGYRYPIIETMTTTLGKEMLLEEMFFCTPESQELLGIDEENEVARTRDANAEELKKIEESTGFRYEISLSEGDVSIRYHLNSPAKIEALLISNQGYLYRHVEQDYMNGTGRMDMSTDGLPRGQYIVYLNVNEKIYTEKINIR